MYIILGANGHVGSAAAEALLAAGEPVTAVLHSADQQQAWQARNARTAVVDVCDTDALRDVFRAGTRAFLLNPPADTGTDTEVEEHRTARCIVEALDGSGLEKVVVESTYGAQPGKRIGDLNILYDLEQALQRQPIPTTIQRAAYYMSNWDGMLEAAQGGTLPTLFAPDLQIPMVAPVDLGRAAARRLGEPADDGDIHYFEGPERYAPQDVADAFADALGHPVKVATAPRETWVDTFKSLGFSDAAAQSYAKMTEVSVDQGFMVPDDPERGTTSLRSYIADLVQRSQKQTGIG